MKYENSVACRGICAEHTKNCWARRTALESTLILILCISLPFLIGMSTIYALLLMNTFPAIDCNDICNKTKQTESVNASEKSDLRSGIFRVFDNESQESTPNYIILEAAKSLEERDYINFTERTTQQPDATPPTPSNPPATFPYLAGIYQNYYLDDDVSKEFLCPGALLTPTYVLTAGQCVRRPGRDYDDVDGVHVRAGSDRWSRGGVVRPARRILFSGDGHMAALLVDVAFPIDATATLTVASRAKLHWEQTTMVTWRTSEDLPLRFRKKYVRASKTTLNSCGDDAEPKENLVCGVEVEVAEICTVDTGSLLTDGFYLYGVQIGEVCREGEKALHFHGKPEKYVDWIKTFAVDVFVV